MFVRWDAQRSLRCNAERTASVFPLAALVCAPAGTSKSRWPRAGGELQEKLSDEETTRQALAWLCRQEQEALKASQSRVRDLERAFELLKAQHERLRQQSRDPPVTHASTQVRTVSTFCYIGLIC